MCQKVNNTLHKVFSFNHTCESNIQILSPPSPLSRFYLAGVHIAEMLHKKELFGET